MTLAAYTHHVCLALRGVVPPSDSTAAVDLGELSSGITARIISTDDPSLDLLIYKGALGYMLGTGGVVEGDARFTERLSDATATVRDSIAREARGRAILHIRKTGNIPNFQPTIVTEGRSFSTCLDDIDGAFDPRLSAREVSAVLGALSMSHSRLAGVKPVASALIVDRADGKPIYWFQITMGAVSAYVSAPFSPTEISHLKRRYSGLAENVSLERVTRLMRASLESDGDRLRAFLAAWNALEIFTNKVFSDYEAALKARIADATRSSAPTSTVASLLKEKYWIADRFAVVATALTPGTADADIALFRRIKYSRDRISHGLDIIEDSLPIDDVRSLSQRYLGLHVEAISPTS